MIALAFRALANVVAFLLLVALALTGLAVAIFSIQGGDSPLSLPALAQHLRLPELRDEAGAYLGQLEADGPLAKRSALAGLVSVLAGLVLLVAALARRPQGEVVLGTAQAGRLAASPQALGEMAAARAREVRGVTEARAKVEPRRGGTGGRLRVRAAHSRSEQAADVERRVGEQIAVLAESFGLEASVRARPGERGARAQ